MGRSGNTYSFFHLHPLLPLFLILSSLTIPVHSNQLNATTTVSVSPSSVSACVGQQFSINVIISSVSDLYGWEFWLNWNAALLDVVSVIEGPFLKAKGQTFFTCNINSTLGYMVADCTLLGPIFGANGDGTLATVTFRVKNSGECPLDLYNVTLLNSREEPIYCQVVDGYGYFTPPHDVAVTQISVSPITVFPGSIININVTVQNQGGFAEVFNVTAYVNSESVGMKSVSLSSGSTTTKPFTWNTTGFEKGDYTISASASVVPGEVDTADNVREADNVVTILTLGHDVAVISVKPFKTVAAQGYDMYITGKVKNYGAFSETFGTTLYVTATAIGTKTVTLASGASANLDFVWNTAGFVKGNYAVSAIADTVQGETETGDNTFNDGNVLLTIPGDINGDRKVDGVDFVLVIKAMGSVPGSSKWNPNADINSDVKVDGKDFVLVIKYIGKSW